MEEDAEVEERGKDMEAVHCSSAPLLNKDNNYNAPGSRHHAMNVCVFPLKYD